MSTFDYDLFVIGAGSGGVRAARMAASFGARVAIAEDQYMGGTCVNVGCVPKKLYVYASQFGKGFDDAVGFGWKGKKPQFDWTTLRDNKKAEIARLNAIYDNLLQGAGADVINGRGRIIDAHTVAIGDTHYSAEKLLIATGGWPFVPDFPGNEYAVTSNEIFDLETFPRRLVIVGGGYIAVEFAGIFSGLGANVTQLYRRSLFLRGFDLDLRKHAAQEIPNSGIDLKFEVNVSGIKQVKDGLQVTLDDGTELEADAVLYATGRHPNLADLGLENVNVTLNDAGTIAVDRAFQTGEASIFAVGDVIGGMELTPVALAEGMAFARRQFGGMEQQVDYDFIPSAVFCQPTIGTVGFTEEQARAEFGELRLFKSIFRPLKHTLSGREEKSFMKLIVDATTDRVVGLHMMGPDAGEITQGFAVAMRAGATKAIFDTTIGIHPTTAEEFVTMREPWTGD